MISKYKMAVSGSPQPITQRLPTSQDFAQIPIKHSVSATPTPQTNVTTPIITWQSQTPSTAQINVPQGELPFQNDQWYMINKRGQVEQPETITQREKANIDYQNLLIQRVTGESPIYISGSQEREQFSKVALGEVEKAKQLDFQPRKEYEIFVNLREQQKQIKSDAINADVQAMKYLEKRGQTWTPDYEQRQKSYQQNVNELRQLQGLEPMGVKEESLFQKALGVVEAGGTAFQRTSLGHEYRTGIDVLESYNNLPASERARIDINPVAKLLGMGLSSLKEYNVKQQQAQEGGEWLLNKMIKQRGQVSEGSAEAVKLDKDIYKLERTLHGRTYEGNAGSESYFGQWKQSIGALSTRASSLEFQEGAVRSVRQIAREKPVQAGTAFVAGVALGASAPYALATVSEWGAWSLPASYALQIGGAGLMVGAGLGLVQASAQGKTAEEGGRYFGETGTYLGLGMAGAIAGGATIAQYGNKAMLRQSSLAPKFELFKITKKLSASATQAGKTPETASIFDYRYGIDIGRADAPNLIGYRGKGLQRIPLGSKELVGGARLGRVEIGKGGASLDIGASTDVARYGKMYQPSGVAETNAYLESIKGTSGSKKVTALVRAFQKSTTSTYGKESIVRRGFEADTSSSKFKSAPRTEIGKGDTTLDIKTPFERYFKSFFEDTYAYGVPKTDTFIAVEGTRNKVQAIESGQSQLLSDIYIQTGKASVKAVSMSGKNRFGKIAGIFKTISPKETREFLTRYRTDISRANVEARAKVPRMSSAQREVALSSFQNIGGQTAYNLQIKNPIPTSDIDIVMNTFETITGMPYYASEQMTAVTPSNPIDVSGSWFRGYVGETRGVGRGVSSASSSKPFFVSIYSISESKSSTSVNVPSSSVSKSSKSISYSSPMSSSIFSSSVSSPISQLSVSSPQSRSSIRSSPSKSSGSISKLSSSVSVSSPSSSSSSLLKSVSSPYSSSPSSSFYSSSSSSSSSSSVPKQPPPPPPPPLFILPSFRIDKKSGKPQGKKARIKTRYTASFDAVVFGEFTRRKPTKAIYTGDETRRIFDPTGSLQRMTKEVYGKQTGVRGI